MSYDPKKALSGIHAPNKATQDRIHLGNKGHNLIKLASLGIPVPPGFIITTEVFRCKKAVNSFRYVHEHLTDCIREHLATLEKQTGKVFGDNRNPLLVSVRSGGALSMPGMMISFLNVGMNEHICEGLIQKTSRPWFVWDCYRRFLQCWGMSFGMERDQYDEIMNIFKDKFKVLRKILFSPEQMRDLALTYRASVMNHGIEIIDDPFAQLEIAIEQVFRSWDSKKAQAYREIMDISENWGTAVIVQSMAYGNLDTNSGTGVLFTRNPQEAGDRVMLWGDFAIGAQGEDACAAAPRAIHSTGYRVSRRTGAYGGSLRHTTGAEKTQHSLDGGQIRCLLWGGMPPDDVAQHREAAGKEEEDGRHAHRCPPAPAWSRGEPYMPCNGSHPSGEQAATRCAARSRRSPTLA